MRLLDISEVQNMQLELMKKLHAFLVDNSIKYYLIAGSALGAARHGKFIPWDDDIDIGMFRCDYEKFLSIAGSFCPDYEIINYRNAKNCDFTLTRIYFKNTYIENPYIKDTCLDKRLYLDVFPLDNIPDSIDEQVKYEAQIKKKKRLIERIDARNYNNGKVALLLKQLFSMLLRPFRQCILKSLEILMRKYENTDTEFVCSLCSQYSFAKQAMRKDVYGTPVLREFADTTFYSPENLDLYLRTLYGDNYMEIPPVEKRRKGHNIYLTSED